MKRIPEGLVFVVLALGFAFILHGLSLLSSVRQSLGPVPREIAQRDRIKHAAHLPGPTGTGPFGINAVKLVTKSPLRFDALQPGFPGKLGWYDLSNVASGIVFLSPNHPGIAVVDQTRAVFYFQSDD